MTESVTQRAVEALLFERSGYERRALPDRVEQVNAQLKALGYKEPPKARQTPPKNDA